MSLYLSRQTSILEDPSFWCDTYLASQVSCSFARNPGTGGSSHEPTVPVRVHPSTGTGVSALEVPWTSVDSCPEVSPSVV